MTDLLFYRGGSGAELASMILSTGSYGPDAARQIAEFAESYGITETAASRILRDRGDLPEAWCVPAFSTSNKGDEL
jgi:hypothetical protein